MSIQSMLKQVKFDQNGLVAAIIQEVKTNQVLMLAYMNPQALTKTLQSGRTYFWSRSRKKLWLKGETSGHTQKVHAVFLDCDGDTLLIKVKQAGASCHKGYHCCFFRKIDLRKLGLKISGRKLFDPNHVYQK